MKKWLLFLVSCCVALMAQAFVVGPYPVEDPNTLHLYQFDGTGYDTVQTNWIDLVLGGNASTDAESYSGFAWALDAGGSGGYAAADSNPVLISDFVGAGGAFTFEAIIQPAIALNPSHHMQIICGDDGDGVDARGWHFRINTSGNLQFTKITGVEDFQFAVPTSGTHAYQVGAWYHVAVTYNGMENTADNLQLYWTKLDSGAAQAQQLASFQMVSDIDGTQNTNFCIGNELRGSPDEVFEGLIDSVRISGQARAAGQMMFRTTVPWAKNPSPANGAVDVDPVTTTQLAWDTADVANVTKHFLYLVEGAPDFSGITPIEVTDTVDPIEASVSLDLDKVYYWRVDESINGSAPEATETVTGPVWTFDALLSVPEITADPTTQQVGQTETAIFDASLESLTLPTVTWYKGVEPNEVSVGSVTTASSPVVIGDYTLTLMDLGSGDYMTELQISNAEPADQGRYFCGVTNSSGLFDYSNSADLIIKRLLAYYPFDGNADDAVGTNHGTEINTPAYISGIKNQAISLIGSQSEYVELSTSAYPSQVTGGGLGFGSILCWLKLDAFGGGAAMLTGTHNDGSGPAYQMWLSGDGNTINFRMRQNSGDSGMPQVAGTAPANIVGDGKFHMIAATYEKGGVGQLYLDGVPIGGSDGYTPTPSFDGWDYPLVIGANNDRGTVKDFLSGAIDDLQIYNYALSIEEIATEYLATAPESYICLNPYESAYDVNEDCIVDIQDVAALAGEWLGCGRYPLERCGD